MLTESIAALRAGDLTDPHGLLGLTEADGQPTARCWRPGAEAASVVLPDGTRVDAARLDAAGLFAATLPARPSPGGYRWRVAYPDGLTVDLADPYAFEGPLAPFDAHLDDGSRPWQRYGGRPTTLDGVDGVAFAVWAPAARAVRVVGTFNDWDGRLHPLRLDPASGVWEVFVPDVADGARYKYELVTAEGELVTRADPWALAADAPPGNASRVHRSTFTWRDHSWRRRRGAHSPAAAPLSAYEVHLPSWSRRTDGTLPDYRALAEPLADHLDAIGASHVEFLPLAEHPFDGSWGYQVTGYFAPTARLGDPDGLRALIDTLHRRGFGVILDWVPAHFPRDEWALARFDGTPCYESADPDHGEIPAWGTLVFDFAKPEVREFLLSSARFWIGELHADGLRVDAVAQMLHLDRADGQSGAGQDPHGAAFVRELTETLHAEFPGVFLVAEESTSWAGVTSPVAEGGLGFDLKWNMGWSHDTLAYVGTPPAERPAVHRNLTFGLLYAFEEAFVLALSHDDAAPERGSLLSQMAGQGADALATLRALYGWTWAHPGKPLLFQGGEIAQARPWDPRGSLDWALADEPAHAGVLTLVGDLNAAYRERPALWQRDARHDGFRWLDPDSAEASVLSFIRWADEAHPLICVANFSDAEREVRVGLPWLGPFHRLLDTDDPRYGGAARVPERAVAEEPTPWQDQPASTLVRLAPLSTVWLAPG